MAWTTPARSLAWLSNCSALSRASKSDTGQTGNCCYASASIQVFDTHGRRQDSGGDVKLTSRPKFCPRPQTRPRRIVLGLSLEHLSSACPQNFYFGLMKMSVMMELVIIVSLQWLSTKVIYLVTLFYWYKLVQVHVHGRIWLFTGGWWGVHRLSMDSAIVLGLEDLSSALSSKVCSCLTSLDFCGVGPRGGRAKNIGRAGQASGNRTYVLGTWRHVGTAGDRAEGTWTQLPPAPAPLVPPMSIRQCNF